MIDLAKLLIGICGLSPEQYTAPYPTFPNEWEAKCYIMVKSCVELYDGIEAKQCVSGASEILLREKKGQ